MNELVKADSLMRYEDALNSIVLQFIQSQDVRENSKRTYERALRAFIKWIIKEGKLKPTREDVLAYKNFLEEQGLSPLTRSTYLTVMRKFFAWTEEKRVYPNIAKGIKTGKRTKGFRKDPLSIEQLKQLLTNIDRSEPTGLRDFALINLLARTALRTIEVVRADVGDIRQESGEPVLWIMGKGRSSKDEFVVLTESTLKPILEYLQTRGSLKDDEPLFASMSDRNKNKRLTTRSISRTVKNYLRKIGLNSRRLSAHSLRHSAVTLCLKNGCSLEETKNFARHASVDMTLIYAHHIERIKNAPEKRLGTALDAILSDRKPERDPKQGM